MECKAVKENYKCSLCRGNHASYDKNCPAKIAEKAKINNHWEAIEKSKIERSAVYNPTRIENIATYAAVASNRKLSKPELSNTNNTNNYYATSTRKNESVSNDVEITKTKTENLEKMFEDLKQTVEKFINIFTSCKNMSEIQKTLRSDTPKDVEKINGDKPANEIENIAASIVQKNLENNIIEMSKKLAAQEEIINTLRAEIQSIKLKSATNKTTPNTKNCATNALPNQNHTPKTD